MMIGIGVILFVLICVYHVREGFVATLSCRDTATGWNAEGGGNAIYLDRHDVRCGANEMLSQFHLQRNGGGSYRYLYQCCSVNDVSGPRGPQGTQGPMGPVGPMGPKGADGAKGVAGAAGPAGPMGPGGVTGAKGEKGDKGDKGGMGPMGPAGAMGPIGPMGPRGATGMMPDSSYLTDSIQQLTDIHQSMVELAAQNA